MAPDLGHYIGNDGCDSMNEDHRPRAGPALSLTSHVIGKATVPLCALVSHL